MSGMMDIDHKRVRTYRVRGRRRDGRVTAEAGKAETTGWACVDLGAAGYRNAFREEGQTAGRAGYRPKEGPDEPEELLWDERRERDLDYFYDEEPDDIYEPRPRREGILARTGRWGIDMWDRSLDRAGRVGTGAWRRIAVLAGVFAAGLIAESQLYLLGRAADLLAAAALALRGWLNPGVPAVLLLTGAVVLTGAWLLRWALRGPEEVSRPRKRASIPRTMMDRHF